MKKLILLVGTVILMISFMENQSASKIGSDNMEIDFHKFNSPAPAKFTETVKTVSSNENKNTPGEEIDQGWYQKVMENIEKEEYNISYNEELGAYQSPNRVNNIRFIYHKDGFTAVTRDVKRETGDVRRETLDEWSIDFKLSDVRSASANDQTPLTPLLQSATEEGKNDANCLLSDDSENIEKSKDQNSPLYQRGAGGVLSENSELSVAGNKAYIEDDNIRIDYINNKEGMRQDFIIKKRPEGEGKLKLNISADTKLKMIVGADALMFKDKNGIDKMKYSALKVWDANGRELRAYFEDSKLKVTSYELRNKSQNGDFTSKGNSRNLKLVTCNYFSIVVNDDEAIYPITIDPLSTSPSWTAESNQAGAEFGFSVATAGDVNGDGYSDVIVGAPKYDNGETDEGRAYVFHGSATGLSSTANWTAESDQENAQLGYCVATAGDVNGDGYSDVLTGAPFYDNGQTDEGRVNIYFGSVSGLSEVINNIAEGNQNGAQFGFSAGTGGDINGDGYSDVVVGAPYYDRGQIDEGNVFGFFGSETGILFTNFIRESNSANAQLGFSVSTAGDINGDGYSDIIIGAPGANSNKGYAVSYLGSASGLQFTANWFRNSPAVNTGDHKFGYCVSTAGDVNGDGYSDVILGAPFAGSESGYAYIFHGSSTGLLINPNWTYSFNSPGQRFGISVATTGDVNGDGYSDIIVGSKNYFGNPAAFFLKGSTTGISGNVVQLYGIYVSTAGDVNGDGYSDVIIGNNLYSNGEVDEGVSFVYNGSPAGLSAAANWTAESDQAGTYFGQSVSSAGDVNGDGYSDVLVGAPLFDNGETDEGRAFLYNGSASGLSTVASWFIEGNQINAQLGLSVTTMGDVNGDGYSDVAVGAPLQDANFTDEGRVYFYYGSASGLPFGYNGFYSGNQENAHFGYSLSTAGDVNGDGYSDFIVSAPLYDNIQINEGFVFVYYGSNSGLSNTVSWSAGSSSADAQYGISVSTAGDVNSDGYSDIIVGAHLFNGGQTNEGRVYVYKGSPTGLISNAYWTWETNQTGSQLGLSVACAGDVNGDGFSDVITGAFGFDNGQTNEGRAYVFNGSSSGLPLSPDWIYEPNQAEAYCGFAVSSAGDVNGDGYSDVLVGAPLYDNGQFDEGRAFVFNGSDTGLSGTASWTGEPNQVQAIYGSALSSAGDVNGDGYSDIIVGAYGFDNGQTDEGRAYVYYGNEGTSMRSTVQQFKPGSSDIVYSGGLTGTNGQVKLNLFGRSPFGRADGKIVYEVMPNGVPFSGANISNSTSFTGSGNITDMGTALSGVQLNGEVSGLPINKEYKWRARVQYSPVNNPYQKFGPWKYYTNYIPQPFGCFKAQNSSLQVSPVPGTILLMSQGMFVNSGSYWSMADTIRIQFRQNVSPYAIVDSAKSVIGNSSYVMYDVLFNNAVSGTYYIVIKHRNSIETWSNSAENYERGSSFFKTFVIPGAAYGDNTIQLIQSETWRGIYSGDENQNGVVDLTDVVNVSNAGSSFTTGYLPSDMNGDNIVDLSDLVITSNNASAFVSAVTP